ncbi:cell division protein ZipA C-terminal FtsZ-binding domain-containing protein [Moraxella boevrei]|uniref:cell division protein ZipA C-terminal FtsZ-binding domain-containing protein n=1 Tax=Faucicola boevrei TaxID=346665 RepID=UPI0037351799
MTVMNFLLIVVAVVAIVWGAYVLLFSAKNANQPKHLEDLSDETADKDGLPILPRHQRPDPDADEEKNITLSAENTELAEPTQNVMLNQTDENQTFETLQLISSHELQHHLSQSEQQAQQQNQQLANEKNQALQQLQAQAQLADSPNSDDAFSALANATETITPMVQTYDERKLKKEGFSESSPILDSHIQAQTDNDQDSPLNHATQNINISLFPDEQFARISGRDLLKLFDKYGLKFGSMNMFHRYANKDGTGLLWFSVMMVTEEGILPFDLNKLPNQYVKGLVMFVSLPHPEASRGFDSMMSISGLLSHDLQASLYDETGEPLNKENVQEMREIAVNFGK